MSFDKFIQTRTIAKSYLSQGNIFPSYALASFIDFETDGFLVGAHYMCAHVQETSMSDAIPYLYTLPVGSIVAKVSADNLSIPAGGTTTDFSGSQILISHLSTIDIWNQVDETQVNPDSRQTTIAYDADSKRIPIKSNDRLGVYVCDNGNINGDIGATWFHFTLTAYFVRS